MNGDEYPALSYRLIVPRSTSPSIIKKYNETDSVENKLSIGRKGTISSIIKRKIVWDVSKNPNLMEYPLM